MKNGSGKYMGKCECTVKFLKNFFILSQNEYVKIQKVCKSLREFKAGNSIEEETFDDILDELNNPQIYV